MKALVCESLGYNLKYGVPIETSGCSDLVGGILSSQSSDDDFKRRLSAAKLIFDVEQFRPEIDYEDEDPGAQESLIKLTRSRTIQYDPDDLAGFATTKRTSLEEKGCFESLLKALSPFHTQDARDVSLVLCKDPFYSQQFLCHMNPNNPEAALGVLATAGVEFCLPAVYCDNGEVLAKIKEDFEEERLEYLDYLTKHMEEIHRTIVQNDASVSDIYSFASFKVSPELKIRARKFEVAVGKADKNTKRNVLLGIKDMVPKIGAALAEGKGLKRAATEGILNAFCGSLFQSDMAYREMRKRHPEAAYIYRIQSQLKT